ncbi:MAG TPA: sugar phosphate nucleotidyltransferase [Polyangiaceae bacterium]|nr:sugar phosphate nucleotidyltransferase [Polyangiaceae bacterium]
MNESARGQLWTIILAGGEGVRLRQLTRALHGEECPKQFAMIHGGRSLLQWTVSRALRWSPAERIVVVVASEREELAVKQLIGYGAVDVVAQPSNRGTGPGILLPLSRIMARDPEARVVVMPSDHYVRDEASFERSIRVATLASDDQVALIGAVPDHAETQYGWIVTGRTLAAQRGSVVHHFCEKPPAALAERLLRQGALWNTFIMAGAVRHFWKLASEHLPAALSLFERYRDVVDAPSEAAVLQQIYRYMPVSDFSRDLLQKAHGLRAVPLAECGWSDWGTPERVLESLRHHDDYVTLSQRLAVALLSP